ncbi:MAG: 30S ribosomal protein S6e [Nanoarchaeota archaeon]
MEFKLNFGDPKTGKTFKKVIKDDDCKPFLGKKIGDQVKGDLLGLEGYEFEIAGGSDYCGFPMRKDVEGSMRKKVLLAYGVGIHPGRKGLRRRKTVAGNTVYSRTSQVNLKILKHGKAPLAEAKAEEGEAKEEVPKEEHKKEKKEAGKEEQKKEAKEEKPAKEHKKEEKPQEEAKEEKEGHKPEKPAKEEKHKKEEKEGTQ